jgi:hypothetical protein
MNFFFHPKIPQNCITLKLISQIYLIFLKGKFEAEVKHLLLYSKIVELSFQVHNKTEDIKNCKKRHLKLTEFSIYLSKKSKIAPPLRIKEDDVGCKCFSSSSLLSSLTSSSSSSYSSYLKYRKNVKNHFSINFCLNGNSTASCMRARVKKCEKSRKSSGKSKLKKGKFDLHFHSGNL